MALALVWLAGGLSITFFSQGVLGGMDLGAVFFTFSTWWLVFLLLLRPGLPLILWDMLRNRAEYSEWSMINEITVLIDVSKIARVNLSALKEIIGFIDNPMIATGLRMMLLNSERATMDSRLREIANGELDHIEREIKTLRLGAWGTLGASVLLLALLFGLGIGEGLAHEMMAALIAVTGFVVLFLLEQLHSIHLEIYRRRVNLIHDGLTAIAEKREPAEIEENLLKYFSRKSRKLYEGMKFPSA